MDDIRPLQPFGSPPPQNQQPPLLHRHLPTNIKIVLAVLALALLVGLGYFVWFQNNIPVSTGGDTVVKPKTVTQTAKTTDLVYTNSTYGFSLTFNDKWTGYKVKTVVPTDGTAVAYLYVNLPTADPDWAKAVDSTDLDGYASIFGVSVFTQSQWDAYSGTPGQGTKLAQSNNYIFSYGPSQSLPSNTADPVWVAYHDIATVIATFKLN